MPRDLPLGNGSFLVNFDRLYQVRDIYFPHVGKENHSQGHPFRFGVWVDGLFRWIDDPGWVRDLRYRTDTLITCVSLHHPELEIGIECADAVDMAVNLFVRRFEIHELSGRPREVRLFFHHDFHILENAVGDTAYYEPQRRCLIHYKGKRWFLINGARWNGHPPGVVEDDEGDGPPGMAVGIDQWATGVKEFLGKEGTWKDAEDGTLQGNPVAQGSVDSTVALHAQTVPGSPAAANDHDIIRFARDTYSYVWPRDGALAAYALDLSDHFQTTQAFFDFCHRVIAKEGYFLHKYNPDGSLASSWHPWQGKEGKQLPIQEDETGLVLWALWKHMDRFRDVEWIRDKYRGLVARAANWMVSYIDPATGLPRPSYDLWEERYGVHAFTVAAVWAGLVAASRFAYRFNEGHLARKWKGAADGIRAAADRFLYRPELGRFARTVAPRGGGEVDVDPTLDASLYGLWYFGMYPPDDPRIVGTMEEVRKRLWVKTEVGGLARYENDYYQQVTDKDIGSVPGNPWFVCTLWLAQWHIALAKNAEELNPALDLLRWTAARALPSGVLAEQVHPYTNEPLSVSPLTWSHAAFVSAFLEYADKLAGLAPCPACGQAPRLRTMRREDS